MGKTKRATQVKYIVLALVLLGGSVAAEEADSSRVILFFGDSLTAGYGLDREQAFPALVQARIDSLGWNFEVFNAGLGGETSAGGLRRIDWLLRRPIDVFVLELGANDGLRGIDPQDTHANLQQIVERGESEKSQSGLGHCRDADAAQFGRGIHRGVCGGFPGVGREKRCGFDPLFVRRRGRPTRAELARRQPSQRRRPSDRRRNCVDDAGAGAGGVAPLAERAQDFEWRAAVGRRGWRPCRRRPLAD